MMKIYSWNVLDRNPGIPAALEWIRSLEFDVLCLQEVSDAFLAELETMPFHLASVPEMRSRNVFGLSYIRHSVILSRHPLADVKRIELPHDPPPLRTRLFIVLMAFKGFTFVSEHAAVSAVVQHPHASTQVICAHLTLRGPMNRKNEFDAVLRAHTSGMPAVICGDFNIIEWGPLKVLNWLLGGAFHEALPWHPERDLFEERFREAGFQNPLRDTVTHPFSRSQLDHILVSKEFVIEDAAVIPEHHGSDHLPVCAVIR